MYSFRPAPQYSLHYYIYYAAIATYLWSGVADARLPYTIDFAYYASIMLDALAHLSR